MVFFVHDGQALSRTSGMLEQALTHEAAKIGNSVGYSSGMFVKADGFVVSHDIDTVGFPYMYVCINMYCVGRSAPITCNALPSAYR